MSEKPRAVILAAGCGRRMESELGGDPKCMLSFGEETLLERQFRILEECGIERCNILVVAGYSRDRLCIPSDASIIVNERFETTDNAYSLELALDSIRDVRGEVLVLDSDLAYDAIRDRRLGQWSRRGCGGWKASCAYGTPLRLRHEANREKSG